MKKFTNDSLFFKTLKERVFASLEKKTGDYRLYTKTIIIISAAIVVYAVPYALRDISISACILLGVGRGFVMSLVGFNIGHDAIHRSYSAHKTINRWFGFLFDLSGASSYYWFHKHNVVHHTYTNQENDDDIETNELLRLAPWQKWYRIHRIQCVYAFFLYGMLHLQWVFYNDFQKKFTNKIGDQPISKMNARETTLFYCGKALYITKSLLLPMIIIGWWQGLLMYIVMEFVCGLVLSVVFQLAHVQNKSRFEATSSEWAFHQIETTADFATNNPLVSYQLGGLNFQTIHHLFPMISHVHYPKIQKIVKKTCIEFGIEYKEYTTMIGAIFDHISYLWKMGQKPRFEIRT